MSESILEKLKANTKIDPEIGCWLYQGCNSHGYGMIRFNGVMIGVHRLSAYLHLDLDLLDSNQHALHKNECPHKNCWNPIHLYIENNTENIYDAIKKRGSHHIGNQHTNQTHCKWGHSLEDAYIHRNGSRRCRQCAKIRYQTYGK